MREHVLPWAMAGLLALSGCTMIPKYERPAAPVPSSFPGGSDNSAVASAIHWREFFTDPRLKRLVELSLGSNRDLRIAALNVEFYQAEYRIQRAQLYPNVNADGGYTRSRVAGNTTTQWNVGVGITGYEVDLFGRIRSLKRQALETFLASDETRRSVAISLVASVATQYLVMTDELEQLALARQTVTSLQASYDLVKLKVQGGTTSELDLATSESQLHQATVTVFEFERLSAQAFNSLTLDVGQPLPADLPPGRALSEQSMVSDMPEGLPSDLIARRPDILSAEHTLLAANANIGAARAAFFPTITLTGSGGFASPQLSNLFTPAAAVWSFAPQITVPIFAGGANVATLDAAKITKRIDIANYEKTIQTAFREVADALVARSRYALELDSQLKLVASAQRFYDLSLLAYREGVQTYTTVLIAQQELYSSQSNLITMRANLLANLITLYKALGGGWQ